MLRKEESNFVAKIRTSEWKEQSHIFDKLLLSYFSRNLNLHENKKHPFASLKFPEKKFANCLKVEGKKYRKKFPLRFDPPQSSGGKRAGWMFPEGGDSYRNRARSPSGKAIQQFAKAAEVARGGNVNVDQLILVDVRGNSIPIAAAVIVKIGSGSA